MKVNVEVKERRGLDQTVEHGVFAMIRPHMRETIDIGGPNKAKLMWVEHIIIDPHRDVLIAYCKSVS